VTAPAILFFAMHSCIAAPTPGSFGAAANADMLVKTTTQDAKVIHGKGLVGHYPRSKKSASFAKSAIFCVDNPSAVSSVASVPAHQVRA